MARTALFQFAARTVGAANSWNDFRGPDCNSGAPKLLVDYDSGAVIVDSTGTTWTGVRLGLQADFFNQGETLGVNSVGSGDLAWVEEAEQLYSIIYETTFGGTGGILRISRLNNNNTYSIDVACSRTSGDSATRSTIITVAGSPKTIDAYLNSSANANWTGISPTSTNIDIECEPENSGGQGQISAIRLIEGPNITSVSGDDVIGAAETDWVIAGSGFGAA